MPAAVANVWRGRASPTISLCASTAVQAGVERPRARRAYVGHAACTRDVVCLHSNATQHGSLEVEMTAVFPARQSSVSNREIFHAPEAARGRVPGEQRRRARVMDAQQALRQLGRASAQQGEMPRLRAVRRESRVAEDGSGRGRRAGSRAGRERRRWERIRALPTAKEGAGRPRTAANAVLAREQRGRGRRPHD